MLGSDRSASRLEAVSIAATRKGRVYKRAVDSQGNYLKPSDYFACNVFSYDQLNGTLSSAEISSLKEFATSNSTLSLAVADKVAAAVKEWAVKRGATHYCHWFQPQTGATAEKHDSFFSFDKNGRAIEALTGKQLVQSEPDASSFPSGGRRSTFEARGYTAWDASSPMFLMETENGSTLCIPSCFVSYSGEALDQKTPLLRSIAALSKRAVEALKIMGAHNTEYVTATAGPEQEYFVVDESLYSLRPDLVQSGRSLLGCVPPKGQQLEDHYFGSIKPRILSFMMESEYELYKLGVPVKTRHNEVAPSQLECAPIFESANVAADHNQLVMEVLRSVAKRHNLVTLFHEKPYAGMNGSGKHVNWSLADNHGNNLLEPGDAPHDNVRFLYFLTAAIRAIHDHGALLRSSVASAGNDFRLGANEAPPAIMSAFLGETLTEVLERISNKDARLTQRERVINLDLARVPVIARDNTDRNRTSPFAFTGNKFEFRAVGASASISPSLTYLNAAMSDALDSMNAELQALAKGGTATDEQILEVVQKNYLACKKVCFEGNNYSEAWHKEAESRGLPHAKTTPEALRALTSQSTTTMLSRLGIHSSEELSARYNVRVEQYIKVRLIELETALDLATTHVIPAANMQMLQYSQTIVACKQALGAAAVLQDLQSIFEKISHATSRLIKSRDSLEAFVKKVHSSHGGSEEQTAQSIAKDGMQILSELQTSCNDAEALIDDCLWSLPKFRELIYMQ